MTKHAQPNDGRIHVKDATLSTATITIRHLTVSDRKLTLAVFRQIPHGRLIDFGKGILLGDVWGHVNYWWKTPDYRTDDAMHIVWQKGTELRRFIFEPSIEHCGLDVSDLMAARLRASNFKAVDKALGHLRWLLNSTPEQILVWANKGEGDSLPQGAIDVSKEAIKEALRGWDWNEAMSVGYGHGGILRGLIRRHNPENVYRPTGRSDEQHQLEIDRDRVYTEQENKRSREQIHKWIDALDEWRVELSTGPLGSPEAAAEVTRLTQQWDTLCQKLRQAPQIFIAV
jgi:hypothetical protein